MKILSRVRLITDLETRLWKKAIEWALKSDRYDQIKFVRVPQCHGERGVRNIMTRVLQDGRVELWVNMATTDYGTISMGKLKRHIFNPDVIAAETLVRPNKSIKRERIYLQARNKTMLKSQITSKIVQLTVDLVLSLPEGVMRYLTSRMTLKGRGTITVNMSGGAYSTWLDRLQASWEENKKTLDRMETAWIFRNMKTAA